MVRRTRWRLAFPALRRPPTTAPQPQTANHLGGHRWRRHFPVQYVPGNKAIQQRTENTPAGRHRQQSTFVQDGVETAARRRRGWDARAKGPEEDG